MIDKKNRWLPVAFTVVAALFGGVVSGWFFSGQPVSALSLRHRAEVIEAGEVRLVDREGRTRVRFALGSNGEPGLGLLDGAGRVRLTLGLGTDGEPSLNLLDEKGRLRAKVGLRVDGAPDFILSDAGGGLVWSAP